MTDAELDELLNTPVYAFDFQAMLGDIQDFLEFSEANIEWQKRRELRAVAQSSAFQDEPDLRSHLLEVAEHRFQVSLPLQVRYAALMSLVTAVEWALIYVEPSARERLAKSRDGANLSVKLLRQLCEQVNLGTPDVIDNFEALVRIRNCVAHAGGIVAAFKYREDLPGAVARLPGFMIDNRHFFGAQIFIEKGALDVHMENVKRMVVELHKRMFDARARET